MEPHILKKILFQHLMPLAPGIFFILIWMFAGLSLNAQVKDSDTFFLAKKKGWLGKLGMGISTFEQETEPVLTVNPFLKYTGKRIAEIEIVGLGLHEAVPDSVTVKRSFSDKVADAFHLNTREDVIRKNLFFKKGDRFYPFQVSDNERFLREQEFFRDAVLVVLPEGSDTGAVRVVVVVRDVFSLGGSVSGTPFNRLELEVKDENIFGSGNRIALQGLYDDERKPLYGYGFDYLHRNIRGSFWNWNLGVNSFQPAFNSGRQEEFDLYTGFERPMYSRYTRWTGAVDLMLAGTFNRYVGDSLFKQDFRYRRLKSDGWIGLNIGARRAMKTDSYNRFRHFVAVRGFYNHYFKKPDKFEGEYNYNYADFTGALMSYTLFRQNFYKTNFIYGFGRQEDVPVGLNLSVTGGFSRKFRRNRAYYGLSGEGSLYGKKGAYHTGYIRVGANSFRNQWEDVDFLIGVEQMSRLRKPATNWRHRSFTSIVYARQINPLLNTPLFMDSEFGLPYYNYFIEGKMRTTVKAETVFYHMRKFWGFRIAPFGFADWSLITPVGMRLKNSQGYTALGGGFRTRNENLIFGTIEVRGYYFPRTAGDIKGWKVDFSTNVRFKYNSRFIRKPDFVMNN